MSDLVFTPEMVREVVAGMATPVLDLIRASSGPRSSLSDSCPFPVIVDANVPDPDTIYESQGWEFRLVERRVVLTHHLKPVLKLEGV